jgi:FKBP-type peptidyl-prolyl cis-trans isomerase 2
MSHAKIGDTVRVHYTGKLKDGEVFDSSRQREPLELKLGDGQVIEGFEGALVGMSAGQSKRVHVPAAKGYGQRQDDMVLEFERRTLPPDLDPQVGHQMQLQTHEGRQVPAFVTRVSESIVTVDANHPLAGKDLVFDLELIEIV